METLVKTQAKLVVKTHGYAAVNGLRMYYEIQGIGDPIVYIPPVFGYAGVNDFPSLYERRKLITVDLQGHGRTEDVDRPISFEQHAKDVVGLLKYLGVNNADFFGESFGGIVAAIIAVKYPSFVNRVVAYAPVFGQFQDSYKPEMLATSLSLSPDAEGIKFQRENYKKVAADPSYWPTIWAKVNNIQWQGFSKEELTNIKAPFLIAVGDHDFVRLEHLIEIFRAIPNAQFAVIPGAGHFLVNADPQKLLPFVEEFFDEPSHELPFATTKTGYHPGVTR